MAAQTALPEYILKDGELYLRLDTGTIPAVYNTPTTVGSSQWVLTKTVSTGGVLLELQANTPTHLVFLGSDIDLAATQVIQAGTSTGQSKMTIRTSGYFNGKPGQRPSIKDVQIYFKQTAAPSGLVNTQAVTPAPQSPLDDLAPPTSSQPAATPIQAPVQAPQVATTQQAPPVDSSLTPPADQTPPTDQTPPLQSLPIPVTPPSITPDTPSTNAPIATEQSDSLIRLSVPDASLPTANIAPGCTVVITWSQGTDQVTQRSVIDATGLLKLFTTPDRPMQVTGLSGSAVRELILKNPPKSLKSYHLSVTITP